MIGILIGAIFAPVWIIFGVTMIPVEAENVFGIWGVIGGVVTVLLVFHFNGRYTGGNRE